MRIANYSDMPAMNVSRPSPKIVIMIALGLGAFGEGAKSRSLGRRGDLVMTNVTKDGKSGPVQRS